MTRSYTQIEIGIEIDDSLLSVAVSYARKKTRGLPSSLDEDIQQECWIAVYRAVKSFKPEKGASLKSWIYFHVQDQIGRFRRSEIDGMRPFSSEDRPSIVSADYLFSSHANEQDVMISCRESLNEYELSMLTNDAGINGQPETIKHMAKTLGITRVKASLHLRSAKKKMKELLE